MSSAILSAYVSPQVRLLDKIKFSLKSERNQVPVFDAKKCDVLEEI